MSNLDIPAIKAAIVQQLRDGLSVPQDSGGELGSRVKVYDYVTQPKQFPCIIVPVPENIDYSKTFKRGLDVVQFELQCLVGPMSNVAQRDLDRLMSGKGNYSIIEILAQDRKLGGTASTSKVINMQSGTYQVTVGSEAVIGCDIVFEVWA